MSYSKTVISHGSDRPDVIRLGIRSDTSKIALADEITLTPTETAELANRLLITLFQMGYDVVARRRSR